MISYFVGFLYIYFGVFASCTAAGAGGQLLFYGSRYAMAGSEEGKGTVSDRAVSKLQAAAQAIGVDAQLPVVDEEHCKRLIRAMQASFNTGASAHGRDPALPVLKKELAAATTAMCTAVRRAQRAAAVSGRVAQ